MTRRHKLKNHQIALAICAGCLMFPFSTAHAVGLKENSIITDDTIKLGDVFYDLSHNEDRILGAAPRPGQDMVLDARTLLRIALALDINWRPQNNTDHVTLRRDATIIQYNQIKEALQTALYDEGVFGDYEIDIPAQYQQIILPADTPAQMVITSFKTGSARKTFKATVAAPSADNPIQHFQISGQLSPVITVPVLAENVQNGSVISENDIQYIKIKESDFTTDTIADVNKLIGMTARRILIAGRPIKSAEIIAQQVIERGSLVTLSLKDNVMNITTQVKALENGAMGDVIRVVNTSSNQTLHALVTGENQVTVVQN